MAGCLRRALAGKSLRLLSQASFHSRGVLESPLNCSFSLKETRKSCITCEASLGVDRRAGSFLLWSSRSYGKGRKSRDEDDEGSVQVVPDIGPSVKSTATSMMDAAILALSKELAKLRTGRASPGILDHIMVDSNGGKVPLSRIAVVSVLDPKSLSVMPYDPDVLKSLESSIVSSPLGLNPMVDGQRLIVAIPPLTKENVQALCKVVTKSSEDVKQSIRRARQKALDSIKKASSTIPKDDVKRLEKEIEEITKKFIKSAEDLCKAKEKEITNS
ncbi:ribosome recycling factor [Wolffia australiana]